MTDADGIMAAVREWTSSAMDKLYADDDNARCVVAAAGNQVLNAVLAASRSGDEIWDAPPQSDRVLHDLVTEATSSKETLAGAAAAMYERLMVRQAADELRGTFANHEARDAGVIEREAQVLAIKERPAIRARMEKAADRVVASLRGPVAIQNLRRMLHAHKPIAGVPKVRAASPAGAAAQSGRQVSPSSKREQQTSGKAGELQEKAKEKMKRRMTPGHLKALVKHHLTGQVDTSSPTQTTRISRWRDFEVLLPAAGKRSQDVLVSCEICREDLRVRVRGHGVVLWIRLSRLLMGLVLMSGVAGFATLVWEYGYDLPGWTLFVALFLAFVALGFLLGTFFVEQLKVLRGRSARLSFWERWDKVAKFFDDAPVADVEPAEKHTIELLPSGAGLHVG